MAKNTKKTPAKTPSGKTRAPKLNKLFKRRQKPKNTNKISSAFRIFADSVSMIRQHWRLFGGIILVYLGLSLLIVGGLGGGIDIEQLRDDMAGEFGKFATSLTLFGQLISSAGAASTEVGSAYQSMIVVLVSLAIIWALRQLLAGEKVGLRDSFYKGMYPLVPFLLVLIVIGLQLVPLAIGGFLYGVVFSGNFAVSTLEVVLWSIPVILLIAISIYFVSSSLFALYIVTLPNVRPLAALRSAKKLVHGQRWSIIRKLLFLLFAFIFIAAAITLPMIMLLPSLVVILFVIMSAVGFVFGHIYIYSLYRELL